MAELTVERGRSCSGGRRGGGTPEHGGGGGSECSSGETKNNRLTKKLWSSHRFIKFERETKGYSPGCFFCGPKKSGEKSKPF